MLVYFILIEIIKSIYYQDMQKKKKKIPQKGNRLNNLTIILHLFHFPPRKLYKSKFYVFSEMYSHYIFQNKVSN